MGGVDALQARKKFDPQGSGFDMDTALKFGMKPFAGPGPNKGHFGSVVPATRAQESGVGVPPGSYMILKGANHPTFHKAVAAEKRRGFEVKQFGDRLFSVPKIGDILGE